MKTKLNNEQKRIQDSLKSLIDPTPDSVSFKDAIGKKSLYVSTPYNKTEILYTFKLDTVETFFDRIECKYVTPSHINRDYMVEIVVTYNGNKHTGYTINDHTVYVWEQI